MTVQTVHGGVNLSLMELNNRLLLLTTGKTEEKTLHVGTWNVRTLKQTGKLHLIIK